MEREEEAASLKPFPTAVFLTAPWTLTCCAR